ncbi:MAG: hypothetical protein K2N41_06100, partial [Lachnospiraceae bacterium]|nr:hypothetical protein [Lachnospiraceae bacterium]
LHADTIVICKALVPPVYLLFDPELCPPVLSLNLRNAFRPPAVLGFLKPVKAFAPVIPVFHLSPS